MLTRSGLGAATLLTRSGLGAVIVALASSVPEAPRC